MANTNSNPLGPPKANPLGIPTHATIPAAPPVLVLEGDNGATLEILLVYTETCMGSHLGGAVYKSFTGIFAAESHVTSKAICRMTDRNGNVTVACFYMWQIEESIAAGTYIPKR